MNSTSIPLAAARERVLPLIALTATLTWLGDFLFWNHPPGFSIALYAVALAATLLARPGGERPSRSAWIAAALLLFSAIATTLESSFSNFAILAVLLAVIMGERHFPELAHGWVRWSEAFVAWLGGWRRWPWLARACADSELAHAGLNSITTDRAARSFQIIAPAACLAVIFSIVLSFGNAVFGELLARSAGNMTQWFFSFDFSFTRCLFWIVLATFALTVVRSQAAPAQPRFWTRPLRTWARADVTVAVWQSGAVLAVLNALFFTVNTIDVIYLWSHAGLPAAVSFSEFVHQGVYSLIFAVLLSAVVIAAIFQQERDVAQRRVLKVLAGVWIAQNLMLIAGVFLRLKLYVDAYQLSELRVYVGCFLLLVTVGFGLLAWHVARGGSLGTLLWRNVLATFALFFVVQFPDVTGWVARFNVAQWQREPTRTLDLAYLEALGPGAWPALIAVASSRDRAHSTAEEARERVIRLAANESDARSTRDWRSFQARRKTQGRELVAASARLQMPH